MNHQFYWLYYHPESDCLFWADGEMLGDGMLVEVGKSVVPTEGEAHRLHLKVYKVDFPDGVYRNGVIETDNLRFDY